MKEKKKKISISFLKIGAILFILIGIFIILIPEINNMLYNKDVTKIENTFFEKIKEIEKKEENQSEESELEKLYNELKKQNENLYINKQKDLVDPFSYEQPTIDLGKYGLEGNIIGFINIPKINIEIPILLGANESNLKKGSVHLTQTSYPIGGKNTNSVIAAHRGWSKSKMFREIQKLEIGDEIYIKNFREILTYKVNEIKIINPTDVDQLLIQEGRDLITLITCHPYRVNTKRYVVYCERI